MKILSDLSLKLFFIIFSVFQKRNSSQNTNKTYSIIDRRWRNYTVSTGIRMQSRQVEVYTEVGHHNGSIRNYRP